MEVTINNFDKLLPEILKNIEDCVFLGIDTELSGLNVSDEKENYFETVEERYDSVRRSGSQFLVVQFGLCPFFYNAETNEFSHTAYNFYTYPRQVSSSAPNVRFLSECSSLDFLANSNFDFNKWIYGGIPYLTKSNKEKMIETMEKTQQRIAAEEGQLLSVPETMKKSMEDITTKIKRFLSSSLTEITIRKISSYHRKLIFHNIKPKFSHKLFFESVLVDEYGSEGECEDEDGNLGTSLSSEEEEDTNGELKVSPPSATSSSKTIPDSFLIAKSQVRVIRISKLTPGEQLIRSQEKRKAELDEIDKAVGFSKVIQKITDSAKVVVGHNMLLDIAHTVHQFVSELPEGLAEFKILVQSSFPNLVDTKYMACSHPLKDLVDSTALFNLIQTLQQNPFQYPVIKKMSEDAAGYSLTDKKRHEAGFDAFITGSAFIAMCQYLGTLQTPQKFNIMADSPLVMPFLNKLFLMRMSEITYLNISGTDLTPSRSHVFYVTCPKDTTSKSIQQIFSPFGNIQTSWRNSTSVFVSLLDKDQSSLVMRNIEYSSEYRIIPFATYQKLHREEKKRPLLNEVSPERPGDIFKKLVCGDKSPDEHKKKRPKTEKEKTKEEKTFNEPASWT